MEKAIVENFEFIVRQSGGRLVALYISDDDYKSMSPENSLHDYAMIVKVDSLDELYVTDKDFAQIKKDLANTTAEDMVDNNALKEIGENRNSELSLTPESGMRELESTPTSISLLLKSSVTAHGKSAYVGSITHALHCNGKVVFVYQNMDIGNPDNLNVLLGKYKGFLAELNLTPENNPAPPAKNISATEAVGGVLKYIVIISVLSTLALGLIAALIVKKVNK